MSNSIKNLSSHALHAAAALGLVASLAMPALAETVLQDKPYTVVGTSGSASSLGLTWDKFDPSLGTLTGVSLSINGTASGSVSVENTDVDAISLFDFFNRVRLTFSGTGSKPGSQTTNNTALVSSPLIPTSPGTYSLGGGSTQSFTLDPASQALSGLSNNLDAFLAYFTGPGSFSTSLTQLPAIGSSNSGFTTVDNSGLSSGGAVSITYTYTPVPVPEPSTYALAAVGLGLAGFVRARRRRAAV